MTSRHLPIVLGLACSVGCSRGIDLQDDQRRVAGMLAQEYESVFVASGGLLSPQGSYEGIPTQLTGELRMPFAGLLVSLQQNEELRRSALLGLDGLQFAAVGAKDFRPPSGLGPVVASRCYILRLSSTRSIDISRHGPGRPVSGDGHPAIWTWEVHAEGSDPEPFYVAQPSGNYVIIANDLKELERFVLRFAVSPREAFPGNEPGAGLPNFGATRSCPIWGYRAYRLEADISSKQASGALDVGAHAQALLFIADLTNSKASIRYVSSAELDDAPRRLQRSGRLPPFLPIGPRAWECTISLRSGRVSEEQLFTAISLFGFGLYL